MILKKKKVLGYARVSTGKQKDNFSLPNQIEEIKKYCEGNNFVLDGIFQDIGSGGTLNRLGLQEMLRSIQQKTDIYYVLVWDLNRLSRDAENSTVIFNFLNQNNVCIISVRDNTFYDSPDKKFNYQLFSILAERERQIIKNNTKLGHIKRARMGLFNGGIVYGYDNKSVSSEENVRLSNLECKSKSVLKINKYEAHIVQQIFDLYTNEKRGYKYIANHLNSRNIKTKKNNNWSINSIKTILSNPIYIGVISYDKHLNWSGRRRKGKNEDFIKTKGVHSPIITVKQYYLAQDIMAKKSVNIEPVMSGTFILTSLLKCPDCGCSMVSHRQQKRDKEAYYRYYVCSDYKNKGKSICSPNTINADLIETLVLNEFFKVFNNINLYNLLLSKTVSHIKKNINNQDSSAKLNKEIKKIIKDKKKAFQHYQNKYINEKTYLENISYLQILEDNLFVQLNNIKSLGELAANSPEKLVKSFITNIYEAFSNLDYAYKKSIISNFINYINIKKGKNSKDLKIEKISYHFNINSIWELAKSS
jgi:site-specific DNA recombinase